MLPKSKAATCLAALLPFLMSSMIFANPAPDAPETEPTAPIPVIAPAGKVIVSEKTPIKVTLDQDLKSGSDKTGEDIEYDLETDLYSVDRQLVAPAGAKAYGKVLSSSGHGMFGKPGKLEISCDYLIAADHTHIPLRGSQIGGGGKNEVGGMVALSLLVTVFGVFINGRDVNLHKGQEITMYVDHDTVVTPYMTTLSSNNGTAAASPAATASPEIKTTKMLYILKDGTQTVGTQAAFDGSSYAVSTDDGLKLIKASDIKSMYEVAVPTAPAVTQPVSAPTVAAAVNATPATPPVPDTAAVITPTPASTVVAPVTEAAVSIPKVAVPTPVATPVAIPAQIPVSKTIAVTTTLPVVAQSQTSAKQVPPSTPSTPPPPSIYVFTMASGKVYYGTIAEDHTADGYIFIANSLGRRFLKIANIVSKTPVATVDAAKQAGATE